MFLARPANESSVVDLSNCMVIIPALNPGKTLIRVIDDLGLLGFGRIAVIDDGSDASCSETFKLLNDKGVVILKHTQNKGKGASLKTGLKYAEQIGVEIAIAADADGQHTPNDILRVAESASMQTFPEFLVIGSRKFANGVPLRSKLGNCVTRIFFMLIGGRYLYDTQSGLRAVNKALFNELYNLGGTRYEYEMNVLLKLTRQQVPIIEVPIDTIYLDKNSSSHFRPIIDSMAVYSVFSRDLILGFSSFLIDILLFKAGLFMGFGILGSTYAARAVSGLYNFLGCKYYVFRSFSTTSFKLEIFGYLTTVLLIASTSAVLVESLVKLGLFTAVTSKIIVDSLLFFISFIIRKKLVF